ncbi:MAG: hypothetical protein AABZ60_02860 [Planctomycetota bacterium]
MKTYSSYQKFLVALLLLLALSGNLALYQFSQISAFPDLESFPKRFSSPNINERFRAFKDYGYVRPLFSQPDIQRLDQLLIERLEPTSPEFETDENARLFLYRAIWYPFFLAQKNTIDFSKILSDSSPLCRKFGVEKILDRNTHYLIKYLPYFLKETNEDVLTSYLNNFFRQTEPIPQEIAPYTIQIALKYAELQKISIDVLIRLILKENSAIVLKDVFALLENSQPEMVSLGNNILQGMNRKNLSWVPPEIARELIQKKTSKNFFYLIWLFKPELFPKQELEQILHSFWKDAYEKKAPASVIQNLFEFSLIYDLDSSLLYPFMQKIIEDSGNLEFHLYYNLICYQQMSNEILLEEIAQLIYKMPQSAETATNLSELLIGQENGWAFLIFYYLQDPNFEYYGNSEKKIHKLSPEILEFLLNECFQKIKKKNYSLSSYLKILKEIGPQLQENQIRMVIALFEEIYSPSYMDDFLNFIESLTKKSPEVHQYIVGLLPLIFDGVQIDHACGLLLKYCDNEEMYERSQKAITQKIKVRGGRKDILKRYLRVLDENFDKVYPPIVRFDLTEDSQRDLRKGLFPKLSETIRKTIEDNIGPLPEDLTLEIITDDQWKIRVHNKTFLLKQKEDQLCIYSSSK